MISASDYSPDCDLTQKLFFVVINASVARTTFRIRTDELKDGRWLALVDVLIVWTLANSQS